MDDAWKKLANASMRHNETTEAPIEEALATVAEVAQLEADAAFEMRIRRMYQAAEAVDQPT